MNAETVVRNFCAAFANQDVQELLGYFAEGAIYHNIPLEPSVGLEANVVQQLGGKSARHDEKQRR